MPLRPNSRLHDENFPAFRLSKPQFVCGAIIGCILAQVGKTSSDCLATPVIVITAVSLVRLIIYGQINAPSLLMGLLSGGVFGSNLLGNIKEISHNLRSGATVPGS